MTHHITMKQYWEIVAQLPSLRIAEHARWPQPRCRAVYIPSSEIEAMRHRTANLNLDSEVTIQSRVIEFVYDRHDFTPFWVPTEEVIIEKHRLRYCDPL